MFETIMAATDGSHSAEKALAFAVELARKHGSKLVFCTVTNRHLAMLETEEPDPIPADTGIDSAVTDLGSEVLRRAEETARNAGFDQYELCEVYGTNIGATIVKQAEAHGADHIVVGSTGQTGLARLLLGSVASSVIHYAHCPVTVVR
ncbi:MAG: universal stress protein [Thermoleophilia bacterium]|nr:universal stress protein [Thermoleophilia bacterium]